MQLFAKVISYLFHPIFMPLVGLLVIYYSNPAIREGTQIMVYSRAMFLLATVSGLVAITSLLLLSQGMVRSLETKDIKERLILMTVALVYFSFFYFLLVKIEHFRIGMHPVIFSAISGALLAVLITFIITLFYRISAHMVGISGVGGMLYGLNFITISNEPFWLALVFIVAGFVFTARLTRKAHSVDQLIAGYVLGFMCTYLFVSNQIQLTF